jgi:hypothetical protein
MKRSGSLQGAVQSKVEPKVRRTSEHVGWGWQYYLRVRVIKTMLSLLVSSFVFSGMASGLIPASLCVQAGTVIP